MPDFENRFEFAHKQSTFGDWRWLGSPWRRTRRANRTVGQAKIRAVYYFKKIEKKLKNFKGTNNND